MTTEKLASILQIHVPPAAREYCFDLWIRYPFRLTLRASRQSKVGDFICRPGQAPHITVNSDLHPYLFLITYVHEVAHLVVHREHGPRTEAHGHTWKDAFRNLMQPLLTSEIFPDDLLRQLRTHMKDPMASSFSDSDLTQALRVHDPKWSSATLLSEIPVGSTFGIRGKWFRKGELQRTRFVCTELKTKRIFLVPADFLVENAQLSLL
jgi:SprT protein